MLTFRAIPGRTPPGATARSTPRCASGSVQALTASPPDRAVRTTRPLEGIQRSRIASSPPRAAASMYSLPVSTRSCKHLEIHAGSDPLGMPRSTCTNGKPKPPARRPCPPPEASRPAERARHPNEHPSPRPRNRQLARPRLAGSGKSGREDLNLRLPAPKAGALPGCATPRPTIGFYHRTLGRSTAGDLADERAKRQSPVAYAILLFGLKFRKRAA